MKVVRSFALLFFISVMLLTGCTDSLGDHPIEEGKLQVYVSIYPLADFAQKIGGERIEVTQLVPTGVDPHDYEPKAKEMAQLSRADLFFYNGAGLEGWVDRMRSMLDSERTLIVDTSEGIKLLSWEDHDDHGDHDHGHSDRDPHVWLDPVRAKQQAAQIRDGLIKVDPQHKQEYQSNYEQLAQRLDALDEKISQMVKQAQKKEIIVSHAAFGYLTDRYGLEQIAISGLSPSAEPSAQKLKEVIQLTRKHEIDVILFEPLVSGKVAEVVRKETGAQTRILNPIEGLTIKDVEQGEDYFSLMDKNIESLKQALGVK